MNLKTNYRPDIDGLRGVAVLSVLFYHAGLKMFSGGYVGVDVFFVISGFLITTIIVREIETNKFSIARFYERRIRRIYPALYVVIAFIILAAFLLYDAGNFMQTSKSIMATIMFASNILFWTEAGYFDKPSTLKPLLHTWSLAVEEQFYIFFPLLIFGIMRFAKKRLKIALWTLALASFLFDVYYLRHDSSAAYYFAHLRAWELIIGALLAITTPAKINAKLRNTLSLAGIVMILASIFLYTHNTPFPGESALLPVMGSALIIYSGISGSSFVGNILSLSPIVFIGKISYSLYLWHWPIIIFGKYYLIRQATGVDMFIWVSASFAVAILSWKYIENPFRSKTFLAKPGIFIFAGSVMAIALAIAGVIYLNNGMPKRFENENFTSLAKTGKRWKLCSNDQLINADDLIICDIGPASSRPSFILWGDSHAHALAAAVDISARKDGISGYLATLDACPPLLGVDRAGRDSCYKFNDTVIDYIEAHPELKTVIIAGRWALSAEGTRYKTEEDPTVVLVDMLPPGQPGTNAAIFDTGINRTVKKLLELNRKVIIVLSIPEVGYDVPSAYFIALRTGRDINEIIAPTFDEYINRNHTALTVMKEVENRYHVQMIDPAKALCDRNRCKVVVDGQFLYQDGHHLSMFGSQYVSDIFDPLFSEMSPLSVLR